MKTMSFYLFFLVPVLCCASDLDVKRNNDELELIIKSSRIEDYAQYWSFKDTLGFNFHKSSESIVKEQGVENPRVLGLKQNFDFISKNSSKISIASSDEKYWIFISKTENKKIVDLSFNLDPQSLCINKKNFSEKLYPVKVISHAHSGGEHLEKEINGKHSKTLIVFFNDKDCAVKFRFSQSD